MIRREFKYCPRCKSPLTQCTSFNGGVSEFWLECTNLKCNTYVCTYVPMEHQQAVHKDAHRIIGNFGGYGTGKTTTSRMECYKHMLITPNTNMLIGAAITSQYEQTIKRDIEEDIPASFVRDYSTQKSYMDFINGTRLMYRPLDDEGKLRSYNLSWADILEASEVDQAIFEQLKTRNRNLAATKPLKDKDGNIVYKYTKEGQPIPIMNTIGEL